MIFSSQIHGRESREQEYLAGWQRSRAELDNYRKRASDDRQAEQHRLKRQLVEPLLDIADTFQAVTQHLPEELKKNTWAQGVMHVVRKLDQVLGEYEVKSVGAVGEEFDPNKHEAIGEIQTTAMPAHHVVEVVSPGYMLGSYIVRPAKVKISS